VECNIAIEEMKKVRESWLIREMKKARERWLIKEEGRMKCRSITLKKEKHTKYLGIRKFYTLII